MKTLKVRDETYDKVKTLADQAEESLGPVADALLSDAADDFRASVKELAAAPFTKEELLDRVAPGAAKGADKGADKGAAKGADKGAETGIREVDVDGAGFECAACGRTVRPGEKNCGSCGAKLDWAMQGEATKEGGGNAVLFGLAILALLGYYRWQQQQERGIIVP